MFPLGYPLLCRYGYLNAVNLYDGIGEASVYIPVLVYRPVSFHDNGVALFRDPLDVTQMHGVMHGVRGNLDDITVMVFRHRYISGLASAQYQHRHERHA